VKPYLRVYHDDGYHYNVHDELVGTPEAAYCKSQWPDRWEGEHFI
jgi:hypothetical protein